MRIGFKVALLNERGMSLALCDYACGVQEQLGHEAIVYCSVEKSSPEVIQKVSQSLRVVPIKAGEDYRRVSEAHDLDVGYFISDGRKRPLKLSVGRSCVHAVFRHFEPHGDVYAYVSEWLSEWMTGGVAPAVPHIVKLPMPRSNMRDELGIPSDAFVVGRYGGFDQFNIPFALRAVEEVLNKRDNIWFVFVNTEKFIDHPRALFLPAIVSLDEKSRFISTCDVGLNAKKIGESFGLAIAEFFALGKPVFSWGGGMDRNHVHMTPKSDWIYRTKKDLVRLLTQYEVSVADKDLALRAVEPYAPKSVMSQFEKVFLSGQYNAQSLKLPKGFRAKRLMQEKLMRAQFGLWKLR